LQFISGFFFLGVIFILISQSTNVIGMLLNFAAMAFVTEIDDVAFSLGERGYFSMGLKQACDDVQKLKTPESKGPWFRRIALFLFVTGMIAGYSIIYIRQENGTYLCNRFEAQFGDGAWALLPAFSGTFNNWINPKREADRWVYIDEVSEIASTFRYCRNVKSWVFAVFSDNPYSQPGNDSDTFYDEICDKNTWLIKSPSTQSFSVLFEDSSNWLTTTENYQSNTLLYPVDHLTMICLDCSSDTCNQQGGSCQYDYSKSLNTICVCNDGYYGNQCQFDSSSLCGSITFDANTSPFSLGSTEYPSSYTLVDDDNGDFLSFFGKAVYAFVYPEGHSFYGFVDLIAFYGRRYFLLEVNWLTHFPNATVDKAASSVVQRLQEERESGYWFDDNITFPVFVSEPLDIGTPQDRLTPTEIGWYLVKRDSFGIPFALGSSIDTKLVCEQCNNNGVLCENGVCEFSDPDAPFGECVCVDGFVGAQCELFDPLQG
jgi:hypothetical protein